MSSKTLKHEPTALNKKVLYWNDIEELIAKLIEKINAKGEVFTHILALARGGCVPATLLGYGLNIRSVHSVCAYSYHGSTRGEITLDGGFPDLDDTRLLIVDDMVDSGDTIKFIRKRYPNAKVAVLFAKPKGENQADFFAENAPQVCWIEFPWEEG